MKNFFKKIVREWINEIVDKDISSLKSEMRILKGNIHCLQGLHDYQNWSVTIPFTAIEIQTMDREELYSYRRCKRCFIEMPKSRDYYNKNVLEENAIKFESSTDFLRFKKII